MYLGEADICKILSEKDGFVSGLTKPARAYPEKLRARREAQNYTTAARSIVRCFFHASVVHFYLYIKSFDMQSDMTALNSIPVGH